MLVTITIALDVDEAAWTLNYGTQDDLPADVRAYVLGAVQATAAAEDGCYTADEVEAADLTWYMVGGPRCEISTVVTGDAVARGELLARAVELNPEGRWQLVQGATESHARENARIARRRDRIVTRPAR